jgi:DnaK suppressor protein
MNAVAKKTTKKKTTKKKSVAKKSASKKSAKPTSAKKKAAAKPKKAAAKKSAKKKTTKKKSAARSATKKKAATPKATSKKSTKKVKKKAAAKKSTGSKAATKRTATRKAASTKSGSAAPTARTRKRTAPIPAAAAPGAPAKPVKPLTPKDIEECRLMLIQKRAEILGDMGTLSGESLHLNRQDAAGDLSSMPIHMADLGSDNYELEFNLGLMEAERAVLREIDEALERIQEGTYGKCLATGNPIGKARLMAKPWAKYCYEYTLAQERGQTHGF